MFNYSKSELTAKANEMNFVRDTLEKVMRLADILGYLNSNPLTKEYLVLKGGTAINLTVFQLPRLSVDIDLDFSKNVSREEMLSVRESLREDIKIYMSTQGYAISPRSKAYHSLDSFVFTYVNLGGVHDNIKVEINYSLRAHLFDSEECSMAIIPEWMDKKILTLNRLELFAAKINALLGRAAARDLYDIHNMIRFGVFNENDFDLLRKSVVFYTAISQNEISDEYDYARMTAITQRKIKTDLQPVIHRTEFFNLDETRQEVETFLRKLLLLSENEKAFLLEFKQKKYKPELLFDGETLKRVQNHPMAMWKCLEVKI